MKKGEAFSYIGAKQNPEKCPLCPGKDYLREFEGQRICRACVNRIRTKRRQQAQRTPFLRRIVSCIWADDKVKIVLAECKHTQQVGYTFRRHYILCKECERKNITTEQLAKAV